MSSRAAGSDPRENGRLLRRAREGDETALLALSRGVAARFESHGAWAARDGWSHAIRDVLEAALAAPPEADATELLDTLSRNRFWGAILEALGQGDLRAGEVFFPAVRRLLASWDDSRRMMASWDDIVQDTAQQLLERFRQGDVERPWALLRTIAKRRYLDRVRRVKPTDEVEALDREGHSHDDAPTEGVFAEQLLAELEPEERQVVEKMDLEGHTRLETARELGLSEGRVLSVRRAGLRRIWQRMGEDLPPPLREVWQEMFKGAKRPGPDAIASRLGLETEEVEARIQRARALLGL